MDYAIARTFCAAGDLDRRSRTIDGNPVVVQYAGRAPGFTGLNQLNLVLPVGISSGAHNAQITRNGVASNVVTIAIR